MLLILPGGLIQAALIVVATCYAGSGEKAVRNDLIGIRLWSTLHSDESWRAGHRAGILYSWLLALTAVASLGVGIWLLQRDPPPSEFLVTCYTLGTLVGTLIVTGMMIISAHKAAKKVAIEQVLEEDAEIIDAIVDERMNKMD